MSVSEATRKVVSRYPFIRESLREGMVNYRALARRIMEEVSEECRRTVSIDAIVTAARRYREELSEMPDEKMIDRVMARGRVSMRGNVGIVATGGGWDSTQRLRKIAEEVSEVEPLHIVEGRRLTTVVADQGDVKKIAEAIEDEVIFVKEDLSSVTVISPEEITEVPGVIAKMAQRLLGEGINVVEMMSSHTDTIFILRREDAIKALRALEDLIESCKRRLG